MKINQWFVRSEFSCKCGCGFDTIDVILSEMLVKVREHFNRPVIITSGCRCSEHNQRIGGAENSQHIFGRAADFIVKDIHPHDVYDYCDVTFPLAGVGKYDGWTHLDSRGFKARW